MAVGPISRYSTHAESLAERNAAISMALTAFREERQPAETFGNWCHRIGVDAIRERHADAVAVAS